MKALLLTLLLLTSPLLSDGLLERYNELLYRIEYEGFGCGDEWEIEASSAPQPMSLALLLSAESIRHRVDPNPESYQRIENILNYLLDHSHLAPDGEVGWGLPQAWRSFSFGAANPPNWPYTITTAFVLLSLLDAIDINPRWQRRIAPIILKVAHRWSTQCWTQLPDGKGFFWYSPMPKDERYVLNVNAMLVGAFSRCTRYMKLPSKLLDQLDIAVQTVIGESFTYMDLYPWWKYQALSPRSVSHDCMHTVYTLIGMELYRHHRNTVTLPWTQEATLRCAQCYLWPTPEHFTAILEYPGQRNRKAISWAPGGLATLFVLCDRPDLATQTIQHTISTYGQWPNITLYPSGDDPRFYSRYAAHVLWGFAHVLASHLHSQPLSS